MNQNVLAFMLKVLAVGVQIRDSGLTDTLRAELEALIREGKDSILEPQDDGTPWDEAAILRWKQEHDALVAGIRDRHDG